MSKKNVSKAELNKVKYGDLLAKFTELGVPEVWQAGKKKATMIEKAVEQVKLKSKLEQEGLNEKEIESKIEDIKVIKEEKKIKEEVAKIEKQEEQAVSAKAKLVKADLTLEQIETNIRRVKANIAGGVPSQRVQLQQKLEWLLELKDNK